MTLPISIIGLTSLYTRRTPTDRHVAVGTDGGLADARRLAGLAIGWGRHEVRSTGANMVFARSSRLLAFAVPIAGLIACGGATFSISPNDGDAAGGGGTSSGGSTSGGTSGGSSGVGTSSGSGDAGSGDAGSSGTGSSSGTGGSSGSSSGSGSGSSSGGSTSSGGPSTACPTSPPTEGTSCTNSGLECEYGSSPVQECDVEATCAPSATDATMMTWQVAKPSATGCPSSLAPGCPSSYDTVPQGSSCTQNGLDCDYPKGRCACTQSLSGPILINPDGGVSSFWVCQDPGATSGCPVARPRLGSTCTQTITCNYGACSVPGGTAEACESGTWHQTLVPCALVAGAITATP